MSQPYDVELMPHWSTQALIWTSCLFQRLMQWGFLEVDYWTIDRIIRFFRKPALHSWLHRSRFNYRTYAAATRFHVIDACTSYQLLLGSPWIHKHNYIPPMYRHYLKAIWKKKKVHVNTFKCLFQSDEAHFSKVTFLEKLVEDGEFFPARSQGVPLLAWEDLEE